jgi:hypothetical protein
MRPDLLLVLGLGVMSYGAWLVFAPAGYLIAGLGLLAAGWMDAQVRR